MRSRFFLNLAVIAALAVVYFVAGKLGLRLAFVNASATAGVTSLALGGFADWDSYGTIWLTWWLGDATGALIVTPFLLLWNLNRHLRWNRKQALEAVLLLLSLLLVSQAAFSEWLHLA